MIRNEQIGGHLFQEVEYNFLKRVTATLDRNDDMPIQTAANATTCRIAKSINLPSPHSATVGAYCDIANQNQNAGLTTAWNLARIVVFT